MATDESNYLKVKLQSSLPGGSLVSFKVTPDVVENRAVNYKALDPIHMPGQIHVYTNTASRTYALNSIKLMSRTSEEATKNLWAINVLRHWTTPYFGINSSTLTDEQRNNRKTGTQQFRAEDDGQIEGERALFGGRELLGAPPDVLYLTAYSEVGKRGNIHKVPVVITALSIPYPSDVDYIPTMSGVELGSKYRFIDAGVPFPTIMTVDITCVETHSPREFSKFDIFDFRNGRLTNF
jgi:hypothetical protein